MSKLGGYKIIDVSDVTVGESTDEKAVLPGLYEAIEGTRKAIIISGLNTEDAEYPDVFIQPELSSGNFVFDVCGLAVTVTDDDEIYYTEPESV